LAVHIELTEMLRCPEAHELDVLVLSTGEMAGRMVRSGLVGCPVCKHEYPIVRGVVDFTRRVSREGAGAEPEQPRRPTPVPRPEDAQTLQALLDLSGPGGFVALVGDAARHAVGLASLMGGIHFIGVNAPAGIEELPVLSLLKARSLIPLRPTVVRGLVLGADAAVPPWLEEGHRVLLRGRRFVVEREDTVPPPGIRKLAVGQGVWAGEKS
jgi:uncharacterized protein YbaR (Trm112 family)